MPQRASAKGKLSKKPAQFVPPLEPRDDHPGWTALSLDKRTKLSEMDESFTEGATAGMIMEDAQAREGDVLDHGAATPTGVPLLPPFPMGAPNINRDLLPDVESISSTTGDSPLPSPDHALDEDSSSSSWVRKPPHLDECDDEEDVITTKNDWSEYVFKKQAVRMKRLVPNSGLEINPEIDATVAFASSFVPVTPPLAAAADAVDMEAELEEIELELPPIAAAPEQARTAETPFPTTQADKDTFDPDPNRRQENGTLSPAPNAPDDDNLLLLLDNRMLKNNILKAMDVRQFGRTGWRLSSTASRTR